MTKIMTRRGLLYIVKTEVAHTTQRYRVTITRKMCKDGQVRYAVILRDRAHKHNKRLKSFNRIIDAYAMYKTIVAM